MFQMVGCAEQKMTLQKESNTDSKDDIGREQAELWSSWLVHTQEALEVHTTNQPISTRVPN